MLNLSSVRAAYGASQVLFDISLSVKPGEVVTLMGRNGMGKTTTVRCVMGLLPLTSGIINFNSEVISGWPSYRICQAGIALVPEGRQVFPNLTVKENLICNGVKRNEDDCRWSLDRVLALFPRLAERLNYAGTKLSGGEQQMLAIGRALLTNPQLLIFDEATEGLAPLIREEIWECIEELRREQLSILIIDKSLDHLLKIADQHFVIEKGKIVWQGTSSEFNQQAVARSYLEIRE